MSNLASERELAKQIASFSKDPLGFTYFAFPWGQGELAGFDGPDQWQIDILKAIGAGLLTPEKAIRICVASGHGIGKSCMVSWIILWAISTFENTRGVITANTEGQLKSKTWAELAKWYRLLICRHWFKFTATSIYVDSKDTEAQKNWRIDMIPWSANNTEAFAGLHNQGKRILLVFDEGSAIDDAIWEVAEGALTDSNTEIIWAAFGNYTRNVGRFHECFTRYRHRWITRQIDSRTVKITNKAQLQAWIEDYGEDSDFVKVRVRGMAPSSSDQQWIGSDLVDAARGRGIAEEHYCYAPVILGVDPSYSGSDEAVIYLRQGFMSKRLATYRKLEDDMALAGYIANFEDEYKADAVFIDFGFGTGVASAGKNMNRNWVTVPFASASGDPQYLNKRAEMYGNLKQWLKDGGCLEDDPVVCQEIISPLYFVKLSGKIVIESKDDMKKRGISSPNRCDALALTFAYPIIPKHHRTGTYTVGSKEFARHNYKPFQR